MRLQRHFRYFKYTALSIFFLVQLVKAKTSVRNQQQHKSLRQEETRKVGPTRSQEDTVFTPAQSLDYFRNEIDASLFEWFNVEHIQTGGTTCGYLYPKLGHSAANNEAYPTIKVKFCVRFADEQPAKKGNLAAHCGGPGALSDCYMDDVGENNLKNYNIITFDQRGLGMSWPSFAHEECTYGVKKDAEGSVQSLKGLSAFSVDPTDEASIQEYLDQQKERVRSCWACETCDFHLLSTDGKNKTYHFLEHSGTRQVAQDLDLFRQAIGSEKLSVFGVSYGTQIVATYATMFPANTNLFVVDSNECPTPDLYHTSYISAKNAHHRTSYIGYTCSMEDNMKSGSCPLDLMNTCLDPVFKFVKQKYSNHYTGFSRTFYQNFFSREDRFNTFQDLCDAATSDNEEKFLSSLVPYIAPDSRKTCMPVMYNMMTELLKTVGTPNGNSTNPHKFAFHVLMNDANNNKHVVDQETCTQFISADTRQKAEMVYGLWEQVVEPLYHGSKNNHHGQKRRKLDLKSCSGVTIESGLSGYLEAKCEGGSRSPVDDEKPYRKLVNAPSSIPQNLVYGQSMVGSSYDNKHFIEEVQKIQKKFGGSYYGTEAAQTFLFWYGMGYYWPKAQPVPPAGDITIKGIVSGQLYDPATPYECAQEMKMAFPSTTLITSQWIAHGLYASKASVFENETSVMDDSCEYLINDYFEKGTVQVHDGHVCGSPVPGPFEF